MRKGIFIEGITAEMFRNGSLEAVEALIAEGECEDIELPGWIPVSKELPEEFAYVLVSTDREEVFTADYMGVIGNDHCFDDSNGDMYEGEVVAWMPMPKPYNGEE